jgi:uncharacterized protein (TIGR01777 family)
MSKVVITGGTGLVGKALTNLLLSKGFEVFVLTRNQKQATQFTNYSFWDVENEIIDEQLIKTADYIIHLAGEGIADKRWTASRKKQILESRTKPLELIYKVLKNNPNQLKAVVSASGVGYYGAITSEKVFTETDEAAIDFLGKTCVDWEHAVDKFTELGVRTVKLRTGIVLAKEGGALPKMMMPFNYGFGSAIGSGKQYVPWISLTDLCNMYLFAVENNQLQGSFNAAIEDETTNLILSEAIAKSLNKKIWLPNVPALVLKMIFGEMASLLLYGSRVSNKKIKDAGFGFKNEDLTSTLKELLHND